MAAKKKIYVVWEGHRPGIYDSWAECESAIKGYPRARYKAFPNRASAQKAFDEGSDVYWGTGKFVSPLSEQQLARIGLPVSPSLCVDAAYDSNVVEYRGVWLQNGSIVFEQGPFEGASNNIGEFLAIVHALAHISKPGLEHPVYSDSRTAMAWVKNKSVQSKVMAQNKTSQQINELVDRATDWLESHEYPNRILKWQSQAWGEIPADYGRK